MEPQIEMEPEGFTESDLHWVNNNNSCQKSAVKYPTFDDISVDRQINVDITLEMLLSDIESVLLIANAYDISYLKILKENKNDLVSSFKQYKLNYILFRVHILILKREVILLNYLLLIKFEEFDNLKEKRNMAKEYIDTEYNLSEDNFIKLILEDEMIKDISKEDQVEIIEYLKKAKKNEEIMIEVDYKPSVSGLSIMMKVLRSVINSSCVIIKELVEKYTEEFLLDFFHNVNFINLSASKLKYLQI